MPATPPPAAPGPQPGSFAYLYAQLPDGRVDPNERGRQFEKLTRFMLQHDPVLACDIVAVWRWEAWTDRFHPTDIGVDFVCELADGTWMAVQSKAWSRAPSYEDLGTFWAASSVPDVVLGGMRFSRRLLVCPAGISDRIPPAVYYSVADTTTWAAAALEGLAVQWPSSLAELDALVGDAPTLQVDAGAAAALQLRAHQRAAVDATVAGLANHDRAQVHMACGTGKTLVCQRVAEQVAGDDEVVVVAAPSLALVSQLRTAWARDTVRPLAMLPVCSSGEAADQRALAASVGATTDPDEVADWLAGDHDGRTRVVFATYHSLGRVGAGLTATKQTCALLVADEAHRLAGRPDARFAVALDDESMPAARRVFATATPRVFSLGRAGGDGTVVSMDDEAVFGPCVFTHTFSDGVRTGHLVDYRLVALSVDTARTRRLVDARQLAEVAGHKVDYELLAQVAGTIKAIQRYGLARVVVFHSSVKAARAHAALLPVVAAAMGVDTTGWWADAVTGTTAPARRDQLLDRLRATGAGGDAVGVLSSVRVLSEGVDVPALDAVVFADPRTSRVDLVQAVGRVMRSAPGKQVGYVIVPAVVDGDDATRLTGAPAFTALARVVAALADHDPVLREQLDRIRRARGHRGGGPVGSLGTHTGGRVELVFDHLEPDDVGAFTEAIGAALVDRTTLAFEFWVTLLARELATGRLPDANVAQAYVTEDGYALGVWVTGQRVAARKGTLPDAHRARLAVLPGWRWSVNRRTEPAKRQPYRKFAQWLALLDEYVAEHGHAAVPSSYRTADGAPLGRWSQQTRVAALKGRLSDDRVAALESRPLWRWRHRDPDVLPPNTTRR